VNGVINAGMYSGGDGIDDRLERLGPHSDARQVLVAPCGKWRRLPS